MISLPFKYLSVVERQRAKAMFINASVGDGYMYELDIDGKVLCRNKKPLKDYARDSVDALLNMTEQDIRLMAGEMTAQEMRTVKAILKGIWSKLQD